MDIRDFWLNELCD